MLAFELMEFITYDEILQWASPVTHFISGCIILVFYSLVKLWNKMNILLFICTEILHAHYSVILLFIHKK